MSGGSNSGQVNVTDIDSDFLPAIHEIVKITKFCKSKINKLNQTLLCSIVTTLNKKDVFQCLHTVFENWSKKSHFAISQYSRNSQYSQHLQNFSTSST